MKDTAVMMRWRIEVRDEPECDGGVHPAGGLINRGIVAASSLCKWTVSSSLMHAQMLDFVTLRLATLQRPAWSRLLTTKPAAVVLSS